MGTGRFFAIITPNRSIPDHDPARGEQKDKTEFELYCVTFAKKTKTGTKVIKSDELWHIFRTIIYDHHFS
jgi:hypothetical protein